MSTHLRFRSLSKESVSTSYIFAMILSLALLMAPSMGSSFVPKLSSSERYQRGRFRLQVPVIRGGSNNDELSIPGNDSTVPLSNSVIPPTISESSPDVSVRAETLETGNSISPPTEPVVVSEEAFLRRSSLGPNASPPGFLRQKYPDFPWHLVPNWLTYFRCVAIPLFVGVFYRPESNVAASGLFAVASATDFLDGYLARKWDVTSAFGAFLDPVADKLMVSTSLILLSGRYGARVAIPASVILAREIAVSALREWMAAQGLRDVVQVGYQGKLKTALTMVSLTLLILVPIHGAGFLGKLEGLSFALLYACTIITVTSAASYFRAAAPVLMNKSLVT